MRAGFRVSRKPDPAETVGKPPHRYRLRCGTWHAEHLLAFSCKRRGFCPSCGARRMTDGAAWVVDQVLPDRPVRQWVLSLPFPL